MVLSLAVVAICPSIFSDTLNQNHEESPQAQGWQHRTQSQLVAAARRLLAESCANNLALRELSRRASANLAAVNYHFGAKNNQIFYLTEETETAPWHLWQGAWRQMICANFHH